MSQFFLTFKELRGVAQITPVAVTTDEETLTWAIQNTLGGSPVVDMEMFKGQNPYSTRLLLTHVRPGHTRLGEEMGAVHMARDLMLLMRTEARYDPSDGPGVKAWKVEKLKFQGEPAALVSATWLV